MSFKDIFSCLLQ